MSMNSITIRLTEEQYAHLGRNRQNLNTYPNMSNDTIGGRIRALIDADIERSANPEGLKDDVQSLETKLAELTKLVAKIRRQV